MITHGHSAYSAGCRCDTCIKGQAAYMHDYRRRSKEPSPDRRSILKLRRLITEGPERAGDGCLRCDLPGEGLPLCRYCLKELRGERVSELDNDEYLHRAADFFYHVGRGSGHGPIEKEIAFVLGHAIGIKGHGEVERLRKAEGSIDPELWRLWCGGAIGNVERLLEMEPEKLDPAWEARYSAQLHVLALKWAKRRAA